MTNWASQSELLRAADEAMFEQRMTICQCGSGTEEGSEHCHICGMYWADVDAGLWEELNA